MRPINNNIPLFGSFFKGLKLLQNLYFVMLILVALLATTSLQAQSFTGITQTDNETNFYNGFTLTFSIGATYSIGTSYFEVTFPAGYNVPTSISPSHFLINNKTDGANPTDVLVTGQVVRLYVPVSFFNNGPPASRQNTGTIQIFSSAQIRNPGTAGSYSIGLSSDVEGVFANSPRSISVVASSTTISTVAVSPNTSVELRSARYNVSFNTGQGGFLTTESTVTLTFPVGTTVPNGTISGVTLNSASTDAVGSSGSRTVTIAVPVEVDNEASIQIVIGRSAGVKNPTEGAAYSISVYTSSETTPVVSADYSISSADNLSFSDISLSNDTVNASSSYTIEFVVSNTGGLNPSFGDLISLKFPPEITLPSSVLGSDIILTNITTGFNGSPSSATVAADSIFFTTPLTVSAGNEVRVEFTSALNIINSSEPGSYQMTAATFESGGTPIDTETSSNPFPIIVSTSTLKNITASLSNNAASGTNVTYTLSVTTGKYGRLTAGNEIEIVFPATTQFDSGGSTAVTINGNASTHVENGTTLTATIPAITIGNNETFSIVITRMRNATAAGPYVLELSSTPEPTGSNSSTYNLGSTAVTSVTVTLSPSQVNQAGLYDLAIVGASQLNSGFKSNQAVTVTFPEGTDMPTTIATTNVILNNLAAGSGIGSVAVNTSSRTVVVTLSGNNVTMTRLRFAAAAAIKNPPIPRTSYYTLSLNTSENTVSRTSGTYNITANTTSVTVGTVTATSSAIDAIAQYSIAFTPGANGKLVGGNAAGSSTVDVKFPNDVIVPVSVNATNVKINNITVASTNVLAAGAGGRIQLTLANGQTLSASTQANINFSASAGLENGSTPGTYTVQVATSNETTLSTQTNNLTLTAAPELSVNSISVSPSTVNASAAYNLNVLVGETVNVGESIILTFPTNSFVPNPFAKEYVLINGVQPTLNPSVSGTQLTIISPTTLTAASSYSFQISSLSGLLSPQLTSSSYVVQVATTHEAAVNSPTYSITNTSTTVSSPSVTLTNQVPSTANVSYTINFNTGTNGRLLSNTSTITVRFPSGTAYGTLSATVDGIATAAPSRSTNDVTVIVPASASIVNSDGVVLVINGITNPVAVNAYTLQVKTSVENTFNTSSSYQITNTGELTMNSFAINDDIVNAAPQYDIDITSAAMSAITGYFVLTVPSGSTIPNSIPSSEITIGVNGGAPVTAHDVQVNLLQRTITIYTPTAILAGNTVQISILSSANLLNPKEPGNYYWFLKSSAQLVNVSSAVQAIGPSTLTSISDLLVTVSPQVNNAPVNWTWSFSTGAQGALQAGVGRIFLDFDQSVFNEVSIPLSSIKVLGSNVTTMSQNGSVLEITVPGDVTIGNNFSVEVTITTAAGIQVDPTLEPASIAEGVVMRKASSSTTNPSITNNEYDAYTSSEQNNESWVGNPLPIELGVFQVYLNSQEKKPQIRWTTLTEQENYGFMLERSKVEEQESTAQTNWEMIAFVNGAGFSYETIEYVYNDSKVSEAGTYKYRLIQQDFDGKSAKVAESEFLYEKPNSLELYQNFPNPFNPTTSIKYDIPGKQEVKLLVYDVLGRVVQTLVNEEQLAGRYTLNFDATRLASGVYIIRLQTQGLDKSIKMTLVK